MAYFAFRLAKLKLPKTREIGPAVFNIDNIGRLL